MNAAAIEKKIQLGISLAKAREMFPDLNDYDDIFGGCGHESQETWLFSSLVTDDMCNYVVQRYEDNLCKCVKVGDVFVFKAILGKDGSLDAYMSRTMKEFGANTLSGTIKRIMSHPIGREALFAAMTDETWSKYIASKESAAAVAKEDESKKTECVADAEATIRNQRSRLNDAERRAAAFEAESEQLRADFKPHVGMIVDKWEAASAYAPAEPAAKCSVNGFEPIGPWEPVSEAIDERSLLSQSMRMWRRPLRRVNRVEPKESAPEVCANKQPSATAKDDEPNGFHLSDAKAFAEDAVRELRGDNEQWHSNSKETTTVAPYVHPDPPPLPPGYELPKTYVGKLTDGSNVLVIVMSGDSVHRIKIEPVPGVPGFVGLTMVADRYGTCVLNGHRMTGEIDVILPVLVSPSQINAPPTSLAPVPATTGHSWIDWFMPESLLSELRKRSGK